MFKINDAFEFNCGRVPLLISMPHAGLRLTPSVETGLVEQARGLPDTDWHIPRLYDFAAQLGASTLAAGYSRFVIDLNRPADDEPLYASATTGLYPSSLFDGQPLFREGLEPSSEERARYLAEIWTPYHSTLVDELARLKSEFGYAILFDAHSIASLVPRLFDGRLPDFNLGTNEGASCGSQLAQRLERVCAAAPHYSHVSNGRFKGGYITRHYGKPADHIHAIQLELAQSLYMDEVEPYTYRTALADPARLVLRQLLEALLAWGNEHYEPSRRHPV